MLRVMRHYNIPAKLCSLIKSLYDQAISAVRVGKDISDWFSQTVGVRQGCTLSPDFFNLFLEHILSEAKEDFDDDIDIMSETVDSAQSMLHQINDASSRYGMDISKEKTKSMLVADKQRVLGIKLANSDIEQVSQFKYLGVGVTSDNSSTIDIRSRLAQAMAVLQKLDYLWRGKKISLATKLRLLDSNVIPIATYGCETWTILKHDMLRIQAFGHKCLRKLLGIYWSGHIPNKEVCERTNRRENFT